jgi:hypothetical protein
MCAVKRNSQRHSTLHRQMAFCTYLYIHTILFFLQMNVRIKLVKYIKMIPLCIIFMKKEPHKNCRRKMMTFKTQRNRDINVRGSQLL